LSANSKEGAGLREMVLNHSDKKVKERRDTEKED